MGISEEVAGYAHECDCSAGLNGVMRAYCLLGVRELVGKIPHMSTPYLKDLRECVLQAYALGDQDRGVIPLQMRETVLLTTLLPNLNMIALNDVRQDQATEDPHIEKHENRPRCTHYTIML